MDRCLSETISELAARGVDVKPHRLHHAVRMERVTRPRTNAALNYMFTESQVDELERYFSEPVRQGRPKKETAA